MNLQRADLLASYLCADPFVMQLLYFRCLACESGQWRIKNDCCH